MSNNDRYRTARGAALRGVLYNGLRHTDPEEMLRCVRIVLCILEVIGRGLTYNVETILFDSARTAEVLANGTCRSILVLSISAAASPICGAVTMYGRIAITVNIHIQYRK